MVEMLGVLAIIGVLSVGGISGYSKAMAKFKMSKAMDQMSMMVANIRTTYSSMATYSGLSTATARSYGMASRDMFGTADNTLVNAFGGTVLVSSITNNAIPNTAFAVVYNGLNPEACMGLATADWGSAGLAAMQVGGAEAALPGEVPDGNGTSIFAQANMPITLANAATACSGTEATNSIIWYYY